jgi:hypothetical protein
VINSDGTIQQINAIDLQSAAMSPMASGSESHTNQRTEMRGKDRQMLKKEPGKETYLRLGFKQNVSIVMYRIFKPLTAEVGGASPRFILYINISANCATMRAEAGRVCVLLQANCHATAVRSTATVMIQ